MHHRIIEVPLSLHIVVGGDPREKIWPEYLPDQTLGINSIHHGVLERVSSVMSRNLRCIRFMS